MGTNELTVAETKTELKSNRDPNPNLDNEVAIQWITCNWYTGPCQTTWPWNQSVKFGSPGNALGV